MSNTPNIFKFATSELSTSAFYAWLIDNLNNEFNPTENVKIVALDFVNNCLEKTLKIKIELNDISSVLVKKEYKLNNRNKIDVFAELTLKNSEKIKLFIENKTNSNETKNNQLLIYSNLLKKKYPKDKISMNYLKSDFDFDDPLLYKNKATESIEPKGDFKKVNWKDLYGTFSHHTSSDNDFIRDFSSKVCLKHDEIQSQLKACEINEFNLATHIGQHCFIKKVFNSLLRGGDVLYTEGPNHFYGNKNVIMLGTSFGSPWILFKPFHRWRDIGFRIDKLTKGHFLRAGIYIPKDKLAECKSEIKNKYDIFLDSLKESGVDCFQRQKLTFKQSTIYFAKFDLKESNICQLSKLNDATEDYLRRIKSLNYPSIASTPG
jgi:hypothetical protein